MPANNGATIEFTQRKLQFQFSFGSNAASEQRSGSANISIHFSSVQETVNWR